MKGFVLNKFKIFIFSILTIIFFTLAFVITYNTTESKAYDFMMRNVVAQKLPFDNVKKVNGSDDIILIVIDDKTVEKYRWPWKRELNCKIFDYLYNYTKSKVIIHDSILAALDTDNPESDKKYFNTLSKFDNLIEGFMPSEKTWEDENFGKNYDKKFADKYALKNAHIKTNMYSIFESLMPFPKPYFDVVKNAGSVVIYPGFAYPSLFNLHEDNINRNHAYAFIYNNHFYPSLALKAFLLTNNNPKIEITDNEISFPTLNYKIKQQRTYYLYTPLKYYKVNENGYSHKMVSAVDVMESFENLQAGKKPSINPEIFDNKYVMIGANVVAGSGINDIKNTPMFSNHPGLDLQATALDNIISKDYIKLLPTWFNILVTIFSMLLVYTIIRLNGLTKSILYITLYLIGFLSFASACYYFSYATIVITPIVMILLTMTVAYTHKFLIENKNKEKVKSAMGKFMSEDVMKKVLQNIDNIGLGGKRSNATVLFSDIRGFTSMSETMTAQQVSEILNEYFSEMEPIISKYNGIINKFIGDAILAIFGEPIQDENHPSNAVKCACEMLEKVKELQQKWEKENKPKIEIGIGINTGEVFVGNIGSQNRMEYTVIGDTVNIASRLESYNKTYNTKILISSSTYEKIEQEVLANRIPDVQIRGKAHKMDIYEIIGIKKA